MQKLTALSFTVVIGFAVFGASKVQFQSPLKERVVMYQEALNRPVPLPPFELSKNIDQNDSFWARMDRQDMGGQ